MKEERVEQVGGIGQSEQTGQTGRIDQATQIVHLEQLEKIEQFEYIEHIEHFGQQMFSSKNRTQLLREMARETVDVLVIGGGITGAGIALDAASRGLRTALVDMQDYAAGTSSRSTKLVHGGLRYLKQLDIGVVAEVGRERAIVYENGPHVTTPERMLLPIYRGGTFGRFTTSLGLRLYDFLAKVKRGERRRMLSAKETLKLAPILKQEGLIGGGCYVEYRTDDARLTIEVVKEAAAQGALTVNYAMVVRLIYGKRGDEVRGAAGGIKDGMVGGVASGVGVGAKGEGARSRTGSGPSDGDTAGTAHTVANGSRNEVIGAVVRDVLSGEEFEIYARVVVNAAGPWVESVLAMDRTGIQSQMLSESMVTKRSGSESKSERQSVVKPHQGSRLQLTKGVHIVLDQGRMPLRQAVYYDTPDGRMVFAIPREGKTYVGTTDTVYAGNLEKPRATKADIKYLLNVVNGMFPGLKLTEADVESTWAGIRPLIREEGKGPSEISRKDEIWESESGLITIAGGKLTGYRHMAEMVMDRVAMRLKEQHAVKCGVCRTRELPISGGHVGGGDGFAEFLVKKCVEGVSQGLSSEVADGWASRYGSNVNRLFELAAAWPRHGELPVEVGVPLKYAIEAEMAVSAGDFLIRRTGALLFDIDWVRAWKDRVIDYMAQELGWSAEEKRRNVLEMDRELAEAAGLLGSDEEDGSGTEMEGDDRTGTG